MPRRRPSSSHPLAHRSLSEGGPHHPNFFPLLFAFFSWGLLVMLVVFIDPQLLAPIYLAPFWVLFWLALFYTISLAFRRTSRGFLYATALTLYTILRHLGIGHPIVGLFLLGIAVAVQYYLEHG